MSPDREKVCKRCGWPFEIRPGWWGSTYCKECEIEVVLDAEKFHLEQKGVTV